MSVRIGERGSQGRSQNPPPEGDIGQAGEGNLELEATPDSPAPAAPMLLRGRAEPDMAFDMVESSTAQPSVVPLTGGPAPAAAGAGAAQVLADSPNGPAATGGNGPVAAEVGCRRPVGTCNCGGVWVWVPAGPVASSCAQRAAGVAAERRALSVFDGQSHVAIPASAIKALEQLGAVGGPILGLIYKLSDAKVKVGGRPRTRPRGPRRCGRRRGTGRWGRARAAERRRN